MIELLPNMPAKVVGIKASGEITAADYQHVLIPAVNAKLEAYGGVRILYQLESGFDDFDIAAMWEDLKLGAAHFSQWQRIAIVTDNHWVSKTLNLFSFIMPCPVKTFSAEEFSAAVTWVDAG